MAKTFKTPADKEANAAAMLWHARLCRFLDIPALPIALKPTVMIKAAVKIALGQRP